MTKLYAFQREDVGRIDKEFDGVALLGHEQGLGKTVMALTYVNVVRRKTHARPKVVVVCPKTVKENWKDEVKTHLNVNAVVLEHRHPPKGRLPKGSVYVINYDVLGVPSPGGSVTWNELLKEFAPDLVIIDECQYIKSKTSKRSKGVRFLCRGVVRRLCLSGTPIMNRPAELWNTLNLLWPNEFPSFLPYALKFCLPGDAPILMGDLTEKPIKDIKIGDKVIGWGNPNGRRRRLVITTVKDTIRKEAPLQKVILEDGTQITCTSDHKWATGYSHTGMQYREATEGTIGGRGRGCASKVLKIFNGITPLYPQTEDYKKGYLLGFFRGDGWCSKHENVITKAFRNKKSKGVRHHAVGAACKDMEPIQRCSDFLSDLGMENQIEVRSDGLWSIRGLCNQNGYDFFTSSCVGDSISWWAGFLGGIYDAEGSGFTIGQHKRVNPITYRMIKKALQKFGFQYKEDAEKSIRVVGGRTEFARFWRIADPILRRKLIKHVLANGGRLGGGGVGPASTSYVKEIIPLEGMHQTYTLTTGTGNYVAYGAGSKNCAAFRNRWGWDFSGASRLPLLHRRLKELGMIRRRKADVLKDLPAVTKTVIPWRLPEAAAKEYKEAESDFVSWVSKQVKASGLPPGSLLTSNMEVVRQGHLKRLAGRLKLPLLFQWLEDFFDSSDGKLLLFGVHKKVLIPVMERYRGAAVLVNGEVTGKDRQYAIDRFNGDRTCRLFVGNIQTAGVGWNCRATSDVAFAELGWTPGEHAQAIARAHGIKRGVEGTPTHARFLVARDTIEEDLCKVIERKQKVSDQAIDGKKTTDGIDTYTQLRLAILRRNDAKALITA